MTRPRNHVLRRADELRALQSPIRQRMIAAFERDGPQSVREIAERLGRSPESLYHHVTVLLDAGLLVDLGERPATRRPERVYDLVAPGICSDPDETSPAFLEALGETWSAVLRFAGRVVSDALVGGHAIRGRRGRNCRLAQDHVRLNKASLRELNVLLDELHEFVRNHDDPEADDFYCMTVLLTPNPEDRA